MGPLRWAGFLLVAASLAVLPFAVWVSVRWGIVAATAGTVGIVLLGIAFAGRQRK